MTSGKKPPEPGQLTRKDGETERREGAAKMEQQGMQSTTPAAGSISGETEGLDARLQAQIGHKLKAMFDEVANAPVPDKFLDLLRKLDGQEAGK
jgi:Anti-sigma factor NepR